MATRQNDRGGSAGAAAAATADSDSDSDSDSDTSPRLPDRGWQHVLRRCVAVAMVLNKDV